MDCFFYAKNRFFKTQCNLGLYVAAHVFAAALLATTATKKATEYVTEAAITKVKMHSLRAATKSLKRIAQDLGCAEGTVKATLFQSLQKLRKTLGPQP